MFPSPSALRPPLSTSLGKDQGQSIRLESSCVRGNRHQAEEQQGSVIMEFSESTGAESRPP